jgi:hypothetical protein
MPNEIQHPSEVVLVFLNVFKAFKGFILLTCAFCFAE